MSYKIKGTSKITGKSFYSKPDGDRVKLEREVKNLNRLLKDINHEVVKA